MLREWYEKFQFFFKVYLLYHLNIKYHKKESGWPRKASIQHKILSNKVYIDC